MYNAYRLEAIAVTLMNFSIFLYKHGVQNGNLWLTLAPLSQYWDPLLDLFTGMEVLSSVIPHILFHLSRNTFKSCLPSFLSYLSIILLIVLGRASYFVSSLCFRCQGSTCRISTFCTDIVCRNGFCIIQCALPLHFQPCCCSAAVVLEIQATKFSPGICGLRCWYTFRTFFQVRRENLIYVLFKCYKLRLYRSRFNECNIICQLICLLNSEFAKNCRKIIRNRP